MKGGTSMPASESTRATLSSSGDFTIFTFGTHTIRFRTSPRLVKYISVKEWDRGYLVVDALYSNIPHVQEEYIDLVSILNNLYYDAERELAPIKEVSIHYE